MDHNPQLVKPPVHFTPFVKAEDGGWPHRTWKPKEEFLSNLRPTAEMMRALRWSTEESPQPVHRALQRDTTCSLRTCSRVFKVSPWNQTKGSPSHSSLPASWSREQTFIMGWSGTNVSSVNQAWPPEIVAHETHGARLPMVMVVIAGTRGTRKPKS